MEGMSDQVLSFLAMIIVLIPLFCFLVSSPAFLLVPLTVPEVTQLLRGLFHAYFLVASVAGAAATVVFAVAGRPGLMLGAALIAAIAFAARRWFLRRIDAQLQLRDAGDQDAVRGLRRLHWIGMAVNLVVFAGATSMVPLIA
jgi:hypothetical protein